jgi:hypothetical protein
VIDRHDLTLFLGGFFRAAAPGFLTLFAMATPFGTV